MITYKLEKGQTLKVIGDEKKSHLIIINVDGDVFTRTDANRDDYVDNKEEQNAVDEVRVVSKYLSDENKTLSYYFEERLSSNFGEYNHLAVKTVEELQSIVRGKIKKAKGRLKEELCIEEYFTNADIRKINSITDKIFLEEFGDKLI